ncbi:hypothetical protein CA600_27915 [Paenibacillus sp. VTT E-133280]|uniref:recombinase family protein n=1 Tax=Paenibacillus sp. VTT E-133280 TaxID=1986222 RepID=UPI000BA183EE|nr:recombinase family protein [Paenibacillus sp. VTT E-133280]OZQ60561.1 hypothetical protein CA600_27915 [Paenibacillus sp. VTT E-133280]
MKTALYARHSIKEAKQKTSMDSQTYEGEMAALRNKLFIDDSYLDPEVSARNKSLTERPELHRLLCDIKAGIVKNVIVSRRCRLARNLSEHLDIYDIFWKHGINVIFSVSSEPPMIYSEEGEILEAIYGAKNEIEGNKIIQGIKAGNSAKAKDGRKPGGTVPYGYRTIDTDDKKKMGTMRKEDAEVDLILKMFEVFLDQDFKNFASYVKYLKSHLGLPSSWNSSRVGSMIENQIYNGYLDYDGECTPVPQLRIFDNEDTWKLINDKYHSNYVTGRVNSKHPVEFLLKDKVTCSFCEEVMTTRKYIYKGIDGYYECKEHCLKIKKHDIEKKYLEEAKKYLREDIPFQFNEKYNPEVMNKTIDLEKKLFNLEVHLRSLGKTLIHLTQVYLNDKSEGNKQKLVDLKLEYNRIQEQISSKKLELDKYKGMVKYSVPSRFEAAELILEAKLSEFVDEDLVQFLLTLHSGITAYPNKIRINWNDEKHKFKEVEF